MDETNIIIERPPAAQALIDKARSLEAERDRYKRERDALLRTMSELASANSHSGQGPHCTCSQSLRSSIISKALSAIKD